LQNFANRRRYTRYHTDFPLSANVRRPSGNIRVEGRCRELAEAGLCVIFPEELGGLIAGEIVVLDFSLRGLEHRLCIKALVRYRSGSRHGFEFVGVVRGCRESILTFCRNLQPQ